ncbi:MAG TPA: bifunctional ornithine acetyltransferase/N-acetylglutamate synthase, partial [Polyangia bacterium]|nr:bifunctional ornithine acetyltransferase/N-acetylglutamate synthase [Polyangia bacterium]
MSGNGNGNLGGSTTGSKSFAPPIGFRFGATAAGVKEPGGARKDLALVASEVPCAAAGVFTVNKLCAAPVRYGASRLPADDVRAIVANSGNANALTGPVGAADERAVAAAVARALGASPEQILTASTGGIGIRLPVERITAAVPALVAALGDDVSAAAEAIRTTDLRTKMAFRHLEIGGKTVRFAAIAKGSGMIHPQMATMLCFIATDARVAPDVLQRALAAAAEDTFNTITVDGDMSTNDCVIALANGRSGARPIEGSGAELERFAAALREICFDLARAIAAAG